ncbi:MAG: hypothetical protein CBB97_15015 [Candidatus Endolissoclinum sp. TMED37]|nr:MAG: hypothetical protein CBB97_15015 [Candidatus Endolissoclinum sp. TMED37]|tara:strand:+ start:833 stop:1792 length:960 start_codon:yes stop_codon:yes gene_type:complete
MLSINLIKGKEKVLNWVSQSRKSIDWDPFSDFEFLKMVSKNIKLYDLTKKSKIIARFAIAYKSNGSIDILDYTPYSTIILSSDFNNASIAKRDKFKFECSKALAEYLSLSNKFISIAINPLHKDMRPFLWFNYGKENCFHFDITPSYTARYFLDNVNDEIIYQKLRADRKADLRRSHLLKLQINEHNAYKDIELIYKKTFSRHDINLSDNQIQRMINIINYSYDSCEGILYKALTDDGSTQAFSFFLKTEKSAFYLIGGSTDIGRKLGALTFLVYNFLLNCNSNKIKFLDFVGANSPNRSDFKQSFGATIIPYYKVSKK